MKEAFRKGMASFIWMKEIWRNKSCAIENNFNY